MAQGQFLTRNRHGNIWYSRIVIPKLLRPYFSERREIRLSLHTSEKSLAVRRSRHFWLYCQEVFDGLYQGQTTMPKKGIIHKKTVLRIPLNIEDALGSRHRFNFNDPDKEIKAAKEMQDRAEALLEKYKDNPEMLDRLMKAKASDSVSGSNDNIPEAERVINKTVESPTSFHDAVDLYFSKLETQGRKGKQLASRTLLSYKDKLSFWQAHFGGRQIHTLTLKELGEIQNWLTRLPPNFMKKGLSVDTAVKMAQSNNNPYPPIADKTRADYLGQLKGLLEFAFSNGFINSDISNYIELPNTKISKAIERLPFTNEDLQKIFPGKDYGVDFGIQKSSLDKDAKFWFPLLAVFTGARLEELGQLTTDDIHTCPDTNIIYAMINNKGVAGDGTKKHTKNQNSVRPIPIHSTLIKIGFMNYVAKRQADKQNISLFKLNRNKQGRLAKGLSTWFSRVDKRKNGSLALGYIERRGVVSKGKSKAGERWSKSFHSFRHTVIDNLRGKQLQNGEYIREQDIALVVGHEKNRLETANYGQDHAQLELRKAVIEAIGYDDVSFDMIR